MDEEDFVRFQIKNDFRGIGKIVPWSEIFLTYFQEAVAIKNAVLPGLEFLWLRLEGLVTFVSL